jgi:hypothetical protein
LHLSQRPRFRGADPSTIVAKFVEVEMRKFGDRIESRKGIDEAMRLKVS